MMHSAFSIAKNKAMKNCCRYCVAAIVQDKKGKILGTTRNIPRLNKKGGGTHAEMQAMKRWGKKIKTIIIFKISKGGKKINRMDPCAACLEKANDLDINIITIL